MRTLLWNGDTHALIRNAKNTEVVEGEMVGWWYDTARTNPVIWWKPDTQPVGALVFRARAIGLMAPLIAELGWWNENSRWGAQFTPTQDWQTFRIPVADFKGRRPGTPSMTLVDHLVFRLTDEADRPIAELWVDDVYFDDAPAVPALPYQEPEPAPNAERRVFRITDKYTAAAAADPTLGLNNAIAHSPISLGKVGTTLFGKGLAGVTDMPVAGRGGRSYAIKVAQGFLPDAPKRAYIAFELNGWVLDLGESIVGTIEPGAHPLTFTPQTDGPNPWTGERVYSADFTDLTQIGEYQIIVPGVGASKIFDISVGVYDVIAGHAGRALAYQHMGTQLSFPRVKSKIKGIIAGDLLPPAMGFKGDILSGYVVYDACAAALKDHGDGPLLLDSEQSRLLTDAADSDTHIKHARHVLGLLEVYLQNPAKYTFGQYGVTTPYAHPDILEIAFKELQVWANLQDAFGHGGVPSVIQSNEQHKDNPMNIHDTFVCSPPDRFGSFIWGACFALMWEATGDPAWRDRAERAYIWGARNPYIPRVIKQISERGRGTEYTFTVTQEMCDAMNSASRIWESYLVLLLDDSTLGSIFPSFLNAPPCDDATLYIYYELAKRGVQPHRSDFQARAERYIAWQSDSSNQYRQSLKPGQMRYGFGKMQGNLAAAELMLAYHLFGDKRYRDAATENIANLRGVNAFGKSWISYDDEAWVRYQDSEPLVPGTTIYGPSSPNYGVKWPIDTLGMRANPPRDKSFVPHQDRATSSNEFTTSEMLSATFESLAMLATDKNVAEKCNALIPYTAVEEASNAFYLP